MTKDITGKLTQLEHGIKQRIKKAVFLNVVAVQWILKAYTCSLKIYTATLRNKATPFVSATLFNWSIVDLQSVSVCDTAK